MDAPNDWCLLELRLQIADCEGIPPTDTFMSEEMDRTDENTRSHLSGLEAFTLFSQGDDDSPDANLILANVCA
jgi:hypothetical protein